MSQYYYNIQLLTVIYSIDNYSSLEEDGNIISHLILLCLQYNGNKVKDDELIWINRGIKGYYMAKKLLSKPKSKSKVLNPKILRF